MAYPNQSAIKLIAMEVLLSGKVKTLESAPESVSLRCKRRSCILILNKIKTVVYYSETPSPA